MEDAANGIPVKILDTKWVTHNVRRFQVEKPEGYQFVPGQATEVSLGIPGWEKERRPFTFTSLNDWNFLEFTIKIYPDHKGVTNQLGQLSVGDSIVVHDVWGTIHYNGPGTFIAGGAGITPYIAIFRQLEKDGKIDGNRLIFSNRTSKDIILKEEFEKMLGENFINVLTDEKSDKYESAKIDEQYLRKKIKDTSSWLYICGPDPMVISLTKDLEKLGIDRSHIIIEEF